MKNRRLHHAIVKIMLALLLFFTLMPAQGFAETSSLPEDEEQTGGESTQQSDDGDDGNKASTVETTDEEVETEEEQEGRLEEEPEAGNDEGEPSSALEEEQPATKALQNTVEEKADDEEAEEVDEELFPLTIMHMNDTHAHLENMPKMLTAIKQVRATNDNTLLLHAGDVFSGTLYFNEFKGKADLALMNLMNFDAMVFGNHEFDLGSNEDGQKSLAEFVAGANFPLLGTNIDFSGDSFMKNLETKQSVVKNPAGGQTYHSIVKEIDGEEVGIFGLTTEDTVAISSPMSVTFKNYRVAAEEAVAKFEDAGIDKIIALTHLGYDSNPAVGNDLVLAKVDGIDVIVGGHSHTKLTVPTVVTKDANGNEKDPTVVVQAGQYAENLGQLDVEFDENGVITKHNGKLIEVKGLSEDTEASAVLVEYKEQVDTKINEPSGAEALKDLSNPRHSTDDTSVRANETELGNLITDAMLAKAKEKFPETVIALQNGGGIRAPIDKGEITVGEIIAVLPFGNDPVVANVTGAELKEILEHSVKNAPNENGGFLHVSGMKFLFDSSKVVGERVVSMQVKQGEQYVAIKDDGEYLITTNQFTAQGGDGFDTFERIYKEGRVTNIGEIDWMQLQSYMVDYLGGKVDPKIEGRIVDVSPYDNVTIMHMNDTHAHLDNMPQMYTAIKEVRSENRDALLLHAGDVFSGTLYFNKFKGKADVKLMNLMGFDAMVFGNHEFDLGSNEGGHKSLAKFVGNANFPIIGTNIDFSEDPFMRDLIFPGKRVENATGGKVYQSIVKEVDGKKIGIFGLTTEDTKDIASPELVKFMDYYKKALVTVNNFEKNGVNRIIALTHLGYDSNPAVGNDLKLAEIDGIDVIVGGHSHTKLQQPVVVTKEIDGEDKDPTIIVQAGQYAEHLGKLNVWFDDKGVVREYDGKLLETEKYKPDSEAVGTLQKYKDEVEEMMNEEIGAEAMKELINPRQENPGDDSVRANETELGNLITDAMLAKAQEKFPDTVIALQNGGGIRESIPKGQITVGQVIKVLPFGNDPVIVDLTGAELKEILEHSVRLAPAENGGFLHVSGMRFQYDSNKEQGERIVKMELKQGNKFIPIDMDEKYRITTNQFTAMGGDGFATFKKAYDEGRVKNIGEVDWEQLRDYMVNEKYLNGKVDPVREGRIIDIARDIIPEDPTGSDPADPGKDPKDPKDPLGNGDGSGSGKDGTKPGSKDDKKDDEKQVMIGDDGKEKEGQKLPSTATTIYTVLLIGSLLLLIGATIFVYRRHKVS